MMKGCANYMRLVDRGLKVISNVIYRNILTLKFSLLSKRVVLRSIITARLQVRSLTSWPELPKYPYNLAADVERSLLIDSSTATDVLSLLASHESHRRHRQIGHRPDVRD